MGGTRLVSRGVNALFKRFAAFHDGACVERLAVQTPEIQDNRPAAFLKFGLRRSSKKCTKSFPLRSVISRRPPGKCYDWGDKAGEYDANTHDALTLFPVLPLEPEAEQRPEENEDAKQLVSMTGSSTTHWSRSSVGRKRDWPRRQLAAATLQQINGAAVTLQQSLDTWPTSRCLEHHKEPLCPALSQAGRVESVIEVQRGQLDFVAH